MAPAARRRRKRGPARLASAEKGTGRAAAPEPATRAGKRYPQARRGVFRPGDRPSKVIFRLVREFADDGIPVTMACRVLKVPESGYTNGSAAQNHQGRRSRKGLTNAIFEWMECRYSPQAEAFRHRDAQPRRVMAALLVAVTGAVLAAGTVVTGTWPLAGTTIGKTGDQPSRRCQLTLAACQLLMHRDRVRRPAAASRTR
jgi:hypothetical protein